MRKRGSNRAAARGREFIKDAQAYYAALAAADRGDLKPLQDLTKAALQ
jgi:hypothetical protein